MSIDHISNEEIERDIADTEAEIVNMRREIEGFRLLGDRLSDFKASARRDGIRRREEFIAELRDILLRRGSNVAPEEGK